MVEVDSKIYTQQCGEWHTLSTSQEKTFRAAYSTQTCVHSYLEETLVGLELASQSNQWIQSVSYISHNSPIPVGPQSQDPPETAGTSCWRRHWVPHCNYKLSKKPHKTPRSPRSKKQIVTNINWCDFYSLGRSVWKIKCASYKHEPGKSLYRGKVRYCLCNCQSAFE